MNYECRNDIITRIPTSYLIEDAQGLASAIRDQNWDQAQVVLDCLCEAIDRFTLVPPDLDIKPSLSSPVAMGFEDGIIVSDGKDLRCAAGRPVSMALSGCTCECHGDCPFIGRCDPEEGRIVLSGTPSPVYFFNGFNDDKFLNTLADSVQEH